MEPAACRAQLARLLADEARLLGVLETQLQREHQLLKSNDVDALEHAGNARQDSVAALLLIDDERRDLCRLLGQSPDHHGLAALLSWCDADRSLATTYQQCAAAAQRCREQNDRNGMLVSARLTRVSDMLGMLNAGSSEPRTYGIAQQARKPATTAGRLVSISA